MTFQAYLDTIQAKTGQNPDDLRRWAERKGYTESGRLRAGMKAGEIVDGLNADFGLGRGHAMAVYALLKGTKREGEA